MTVEQLQAENARLKTEVEHLMIFCNSTLIPSKDLQAENSRLKAEVERLTAEVSYDKRVQLHVDKLAAEFTQSEVERLKAEVERLRKFNDEALAHIAKEERKSRECLDMVQAEVERLIKAGDNLITALDKRDDVFDNSDKRQAIADWNAAKEDSQA